MFICCLRILASDAPGIEGEPAIQLTVRPFARDRTISESPDFARFSAIQKRRNISKFSLMRSSINRRRAEISQRELTVPASKRKARKAVSCMHVVTYDNSWAASVPRPTRPLRRRSNGRPFRRLSDAPPLRQTKHKPHAAEFCYPRNTNAVKCSEGLRRWCCGKYSLAAIADESHARPSQT